MKQHLLDFFLLWWRSEVTDEQFAADNELSVEDMHRLVQIGARIYLETD